MAAAPSGGTSEIAALMAKKQRLDMELWQTEKQIYDLETTYLEETNESIGNVLKGWDLDKPGGGHSGGNRGMKKRAPRESERMFSRSSTTYEKSIENTLLVYTADQAAAAPPEEAYQPEPRSHHKQSSQRSHKRKSHKRKCDSSEDEAEDSEGYV